MPFQPFLKPVGDADTAFVEVGLKVVAYPKRSGRNAKLNAKLVNKTGGSSMKKWIDKLNEMTAEQLDVLIKRQKAEIQILQRDLETMQAVRAVVPPRNAAAGA